MYIGRIINKDGIRDYDCVVTRGGEVSPIDPRFDLANHSPTGFCWGYAGSGPAQLALAILSDYLKDDVKALNLYQDFKSRVIVRLPMDADFTLTDGEIERALEGIRYTRALRNPQADPEAAI
jgi:hypothetical protein